jgi:hypothetical protein
MQAPSIFSKAPRWIPRKAMPQIDESDFTALFEWLAFWGITVETVTVPAKELRFRQRISWRLIRRVMPLELYAKPILISSDSWILDGNHRAAAHKLNGDSIKAIRLSCSFWRAIPILFSFAGTYSYGDGLRHKESF